MSSLLPSWTLNADVLAWFANTAIQVTVLSSLVLLLARSAGRDSVIRHSILTIGLGLALLSPISTCCLQALGVAVINLPTEETATPLDLLPVDNTSAPDAASVVPNVTLARTDRAFVADQTALEPEPFTDQPPSDQSFADITTAPPVTAPALAQPEPGVLLPWLKLSLASCLIVSLVGSILYGLRWFIAWMKLRRIVRRSVPVRSTVVQQAFREACQSLEYAYHPDAIRSGQSIYTPSVVGVVKPTILLPVEIDSQVSAQQLTEILLHEVAHIVRRDPLYLLLQNVACTLLWMHPLVRAISRGLTRASEEICDNYVLQRNSTTAYSRTLLAVAQFSLGQQTPHGAIGVVGSHWSLTERIAGLLDQHRQRTTALQGKSKLAVLALAFMLSCVLLGTIKFTTGAALAQLPVTEQLPAEAASQINIRGSGQSLEFRVHGRILGDASGPPLEPFIEIVSTEKKERFAVHIAGDHYEAWLPAKAFEWFSVTVQGTCRDGRRANLIIAPSSLRSAIENGADLQFQRPTRAVTFRLQHNGQAVRDAHFRFRSNQGSSIIRSDDNGHAIAQLVEGESMYGCTAWTDSGLLGGFQFAQMPKRDPNAQEHAVEMYECETRQIHVVDTDGAPVAGVRVQLDVATPEPNFNYIQTPEGYEVVTDASGHAEHGWIPKWKKVHISDANLIDSAWIYQSQTIVGNSIEVIVKKPASRVTVEGIVSRGGDSVGGVLVRAYSFEGESEHRSDLHHVMADSQGKFKFNALPKSTYCIFVYDDRLVSEPNIMLPIDAATGQKNSATLSISEGLPVTVALTSGPNRKPIAGQSVSISAEYDFTWKEGKETQRGATHRQTFATTDAQGFAQAYVPIGKVKASVYTSGWRAERELIVKRGQENRVALHRTNDELVRISGRLMADQTNDIDWSKVTVSLKAVDGETGHQLEPTVSTTGELRFETEAMTLAGYAISHDGAFAGSTLLAATTRPFDWKLHPTAYLEGQLHDTPGKAIAGATVRAVPSIVNEAIVEGRTKFSQRMEIPAVEATTDASGKYRIGPLPRLTPIRLEFQLTPASESQHLDRVYIEINEQRPPATYQLAEATAVTKPTPKSLLGEAMRDARLGGYHAVLILADYNDKACTEFVDDHFLDYSADPQVGSYMQVRLRSGADAHTETVAMVKDRGWSLPPVGAIAAFAMNAEGKELGQIVIKVADAQAKQQAATFVDAHQPPKVDARKKWDEAFALAKQTNRRVWVRISQRYCHPCHLLNHWLDDNRATLEKEFVMLKIDDVRDLNGREMADEVTGKRMVGVPYFAFYSAEGQQLIDSRAPTGNIGFMSGYESKRHFRKMLSIVKQVLTDTEVNRLVNSLED